MVGKIFIFVFTSIIIPALLVSTHRVCSDSHAGASIIRCGEVVFKPTKEIRPEWVWSEWVPRIL